MFNVNSNNQIVIDPDILNIPEFYAIWKNDKSINKHLSHKMFAYIYFMIDFKSPYKKSLREKELEKRVKLDIFKDTEYKFERYDGDRIKEAIEKYKELQETKSLKALKSVENVLDTIQDYFDNFTLEDVEDAHDIINKIMNNAAKLPDLVVKIEQLKKKVEEELAMKDKEIRGRGNTRTREIPKDRRK